MVEWQMGGRRGKLLCIINFTQDLQPTELKAFHSCLAHIENLNVTFKLCLNKCFAEIVTF
jgi:hypothetical protein